MDDQNQNPTTNEPDIRPTSPPLNQTAQQAVFSPQSINPEVITTQPQPTVSVVSPNTVVTGSPQTNPPKSKKNLFIIITAIVVILIALALYFFVFNKSNKPPSTNTAATKLATTTNKSQASNNSTCTATPSDSTFTCQKVVTVLDTTTPNSPNLTYYVLFYKDATLKTYNGATSEFFSNSGQAQISVHGTNNPNYANPNPKIGCSGQPTFPYTYKGTAETGCYALATSQNPNNNQYYGTITIGGEYYGVNLLTANPLNLSTVETVFDSINII